jgi:hypothetical protein
MNAIAILKRLHDRNDIFMESVECRIKIPWDFEFSTYGKYHCFDTKGFHWAVFEPNRKMETMTICNVHKWFDMNNICLVFDATSFEHDVLSHHWKLMALRGFDYIKSEKEICCIEFASKISAVI